DHWEKAARALTSYLAASGEYTYTLDLRRDDSGLDPTLDFLWNVKEGHCERYAGALALMLRSVGIPARVVRGFRGAESQGDGTYLGRNSHAHSWVEVLVLRRKDDKPQLRWLSLDPTPAGDMPVHSSFSLGRFLENSEKAGFALWRDFILDYGSERQADLWGEAAAWLTQGPRGTAPRMAGPGLAVVEVLA